MNADDILKKARGDKMAAFQLIQQQDQATKIQLLLEAFNSRTDSPHKSDLYKLFAKQRGFFKTNLASGTFNKLVESLMNELRSFDKNNELYQATCKQLNQPHFNALRKEIEKRMKKENALDKHFIRASDFEKRSETEKALAEYEKAVKKINNAPIQFLADKSILAQCHYYIGNLHLYTDPSVALKKYQEAEKALSELRYHPLHLAKIKKNKGVAYALLKKYEEAETCINAVINLEKTMKEKPEYDTQHSPEVDLINIHLAKKEWSKALEIIAENNNSAKKYFLGKALACFHLNQSDEVKRILKFMDDQPLAWNESDCMAASYYLKGLLAFKDEKFKTALSFFKKMQSMYKPDRLTTSPFLMELDYDLAKTYFKLGKEEQGIAHLKKVPGNLLDENSYDLLAMNYAKQRQSVEETQEKKAQEGFSCSVNFYKGMFYFQHGRIQDAANCFSICCKSEVPEEIKKAATLARESLEGLSFFSGQTTSPWRPAHLTAS